MKKINPATNIFLVFIKVFYNMADKMIVEVYMASVTSRFEMTGY